MRSRTGSVTGGLQRRTRSVAVSAVRAHNEFQEGCTLKLSTVLIISYHFYPSNEIGARRVTALARHLSAHGIRVVVVSAFGDQAVESGAEILPGVVAIPVARPSRALLNALVAMKRRRLRALRASAADIPANAERASERASMTAWARDWYFRFLYFVDEYKRWSWRASRAAVRAGRGYGASVVLASGPPHSTLIAASRAARDLRLPYVADLRDPWSDYLAWVSTSRKFELGLMRRLERRVLRTAAAVTSTAETVSALLLSRDKDLQGRLRVIRNGYDGTPALGSTATHGRLSILFAGELYVGRDPFPFLFALERVLARPEVDSSRVSVTFMGKVDSYAGQSLPSWIHGKLCASVVKLLPPQPSAVVAEAAAASTLLLNLAQGQHLSVPAKTYEHLASGREILLICENDCETARLVRGLRGVNQVDPANLDALVATLLSIYERHVIRGEMMVPDEVEVMRFSRQAANEAFLEVLESVTRPGSASARLNVHQQ